MVKVYAKLVYIGAKTLEEVPAKLRLAVEMEVEKIRQSNT